MRTQQDHLRTFFILFFSLVTIVYSNDDSLSVPQGFSFRFFYGIQPTLSGSTESMYNDMLRLENDKFSPVSSHNDVAPKPVSGVAITFYQFGQHDIYITARFEQRKYNRTSVFSFKTTDPAGNLGTADASISTQHRLYPIMLGGGWFSPELANSFRLELDAIYVFATIQETMKVKGFRSLTSEIHGDGFGGRGSLSLNIIATPYVHLLLDGSYSYFFIGYSRNEKNYNGERSFAYYGFGFMAGLEFFLF